MSKKVGSSEQESNLVEWLELEESKHWLWVQSTSRLPKFIVISILGIKLQKFAIPIFPIFLHGETIGVPIFLLFLCEKSLYCSRCVIELFKWSDSGWFYFKLETLRCSYSGRWTEGLQTLLRPTNFSFIQCNIWMLKRQPSLVTNFMKLH